MKYLFKNIDTGATLDLTCADDSDAMRTLAILRSAANVALVGPMPAVEPSAEFTGL